MKCSKAFKSVFKYSLRRFLPFSIAYWAILVFVYPVKEAIDFLQYTFVIKNAVEFPWEFKEYTQLYVFECVYVAMLFATVISFIAFSYLHNKRSMDFYGSMPVSRRTQFFGRLVAVVASTIVPLIIVCLIGNGVLLFDNFGGAVSAFFCGTLGILGNIAFIAFIAVCCGTVGHSIVTYILISGAYPICVLVLTLYPQMVLPGMSSFTGFGEFPVSPVVLSLLSPFIAPICAFGSGFIVSLTTMTSVGFSDIISAPISYYIWWTLFTAGLVVASYFLVKKRKSESAQSGFAFVFPSVAIKFLTSVTAGLVMGMILASVSTLPYSSNQIGSVAYILLFCVGIIVGTIISHIILHLIYHKGMSGFGKWMILYGCEALAAIGFFFIVTTGMFGYVTRVPDAEDIKKVEVSFNGYIDDYNHVTIKGKNPYVYSTKDPENIKAIIECHSAVAQEYEDEYSGLYTSVWDDRYDVSYDTYNGDGLYLRYTDKNGNTVTRAYENPMIVSKHTRLIGDIIGDIDIDINGVGKAPFDRCNEIDLYIEGWKDFKEGDYTIEDKSVMKKIIENYNKDMDILGSSYEPDYYDDMSMSGDIYYTTDDGNDCGYSETFSIGSNHKNTIKYLKSLDLEKYYQDFDDSDYYE